MILFYISDANTARIKGFEITTVATSLSDLLLNLHSIKAVPEE